MLKNKCQIKALNLNAFNQSLFCVNNTRLCLLQKQGKRKCEIHRPRVFRGCSNVKSIY